MYDNIIDDTAMSGILPWREILSERTNSVRKNRKVNIFTSPYCKCEIEKPLVMNNDVNGGLFHPLLRKQMLAVNYMDAVFILLYIELDNKGCAHGNTIELDVTPSWCQIMFHLSY